MTPKHYDAGIQPIVYMQYVLTQEEMKGFLKGNIIKYVSRAGKKGEEEGDIKKAAVYARWLDEYTKYGRIVSNP